MCIRSSPKLSTAGIVIGGRRAAMLFRNMIAVRAAHLALGLDGDERACLSALMASIPTSCTRASREARCTPHMPPRGSETSLANDDPHRTLLAVRDPASRALLALTLPALSPVTRGEALCSALAELPKADALVMAWSMLPALLNGERVPNTTIETVAHSSPTSPLDGAKVRGFGPHRAWAIDVQHRLSKTSLGAADVEFLHGVIAKRAALQVQFSGVSMPDAEAVVTDWPAVHARCQTALGTGSASA